jgi:pyruvate formate lyase activating enzyme
MKGGLTISGSEPLMQHRFVLKVFEAVKKLGVHTALDTNGFLGDRLSDEDLRCIDLVLLDLKAMTPDLHKRLAGQDNAKVHEFARRLRRSWGMWSASMCCRSTRWAASSGRS